MAAMRILLIYLVMSQSSLLQLRRMYQQTMRRVLQNFIRRCVRANRSQLTARRALLMLCFLTLEDMILLRLDVISSIRSLTSEQELQDRHLLKMLLSNRQVRLSLQERLLQERLDRQSRMQLYHMYISRQKSVRLRCFLTLWLMLQSG